MKYICSLALFFSLTMSPVVNARITDTFPYLVEGPVLESLDRLFTDAFDAAAKQEDFESALFQFNRQVATSYPTAVRTGIKDSFKNLFTIHEFLNHVSKGEYNKAETILDSICKDSKNASLAEELFDIFQSRVLPRDFGGNVVKIYANPHDLLGSLTNEANEVFHLSFDGKKINEQEAKAAYEGFLKKLPTVRDVTAELDQLSKRGVYIEVHWMTTEATAELLDGLNRNITSLVHSVDEERLMIGDDFESLPASKSLKKFRTKFSKVSSRDFIESIINAINRHKPRDYLSTPPMSESDTRYLIAELVDTVNSKVRHKDFVRQRLSLLFRNIKSFRVR